MSARARRMVAAATFLATAMIALSVAVLSLDYVAARRREPRDEEHIARLQQQVRSDSSLAPKLESEQKQITEARRARKARIDFLGVLLIAAAASFLTGAKWLLSDRAPRPAARQTPRAKTPVRNGPPVFEARGSPTIDLASVDEIVAREGRSQEAAIPILQAIQARFRYLPDEALERVCEITEITPAQICGTSSFYSRFRRSPVGEHTIRVCHGTACHVAGARQITNELRRGLGIPEGADTDSGRVFTIEEVACLGCCSLAPVLMVDNHAVGNLRPAAACDALGIGRPENPV